MKITKSYLKQIIKEEIEHMEEAVPVGRRGMAYTDSGGGVKTYSGEKMPGAETLFSTSTQELRRLIQDIVYDNLPVKEITNRLERITRNLESMEHTPPSGQVG